MMIISTLDYVASFRTRSAFSFSHLCGQQAKRLTTNNKRITTGNNNNRNSHFVLNGNKNLLHDSFLITTSANEKVKLIKSLMQSNKRRRRGFTTVLPTTTDEQPMTSDGNDRLVVIEGIRAVHDSLFEHQDRVKFVLHTPNPYYSFMLSAGGTPGGSAMDGEHTANDENAADKELIIDDNKVESTSSTSRHQILELLMDKLYGPIGGPLFRNKVFRIDSNIFQDISDTVNGQGVIAVIERPMFCLKNVLGSNDNNKLSAPVVVILDRISDPGNLGSLIRSSYGLGVDGILAIDCCDAWSSKVTRSAMAMNLRIPLIEMRSEEVVDAIRSLPMPNQAQCQVVVADGSHSNSKNYFDLDYQLLSRNDGAISEGTRSPSSSSPLFVFIGSEAHGVAPGLHGLLQWMEPQRVHYVKIPMMRAVESFNAAVAGSIILSEVSKQLQK